ncbi:MAG: nuclear transport factor 2 family protein [Actinomycetes bacterium]
MAHPNADVYRRIYDAFLKQDPEAAKELIAPDVKWHEAGNPQTLEGFDAVLQRFSVAADITADIDVHDVIGGDDHTVALITAHMRKPNGDDITYRAVEVVHIDGGKVTERWAFMDAEPADVKAFFADLL